MLSKDEQAISETILENTTRAHKGIRNQSI